MDRDTVIALAREAGLWPAVTDVFSKELERFAALVEQHMTYDSIHSCHPNCDKPACVAIRAAVAAEREECAKVAESYEPICDTCPSGVAAAIRNRQ